MTTIILDSAQTQLVLQSRDPVQVCDPSGTVLGLIAPASQGHSKDGGFTDEEIEAAKRARDTPGPRSTTQEVLARLRAMRPEHA